jgi:hypothetical protein
MTQKDASPLGTSGETSSGISDVLLDQPAGGDTSLYHCGTTVDQVTCSWMALTSVYTCCTLPSVCCFRPGDIGGCRKRGIDTGRCGICTVPEPYH